VPEPVQSPETFAAPFEGGRAAASARRIVEQAPVRTPGSEGDSRTAATVAARMAEIRSGKVSEQVFEGSFDGDDVDLRNVLLTLPGNSSRTILVVAGRDSARGAGAASSAAATGVLLELAAELGRTSHTKTIVLASVDGTEEGARGIRELLDGHPTPELIDAVVVISRPGVAEPRGPTLLPWGTGPDSTSAQLVESARLALIQESGRRPQLGSFLGNLLRLAAPTALGGEAVAISAGFDAIGVSGAGERPLDPADDGVASLSEQTIAELGNSVLALVLALDVAPAPLEHGPADHLTLAGNLIPGWALGLLALTLLLPALAAAVDGLARASRRGEPVLGSLLWALSCAIPFAAALLTAYVLALLGVAPNPDFPFDPGRFGLGWRAAVVLALVTAAFAAAVALTRPFRLPAQGRPETLATAAGALGGLVVLGIWLRNPYLALLCLPLAHVWLIAARPGGPAGRGAIALALAAALVPPAAALVHVAARLDLGATVPWTVLLLVTGGQIGLLDAVLGCLLAASVLAVAAVWWSGANGIRLFDRYRQRVQSPGGTMPKLSNQN
jgi:hypothetical protein